jgi:hypothetical protein
MTFGLARFLQGCLHPIALKVWREFEETDPKAYPLGKLPVVVFSDGLVPTESERTSLLVRRPG